MPNTKKSKQPDHARPTTVIQGLCLLTLVALFGISAVTKTEVPLIVYAIIGGILFGIGNIKNLLP